MPKNYAKVIEFFCGSAWAIKPEKLAAMSEVLELRTQGVVFTREEIHARIGEPEQPRDQVQRGIAVLNMYGVILQRANMFDEISGATSTEDFGSRFKAAIEDQSISAIVINIHSPGGSVYGVSELASLIYKSRRKKKIVGIANSVAASAAYWLGTAAEEFVVTPGGEAGSIGVYMMHIDQSKFNEGMGVNPTYISAGKFKVEGNPDEPLSDETRQFLQGQVDTYYDMFTGAVARQRGRSMPQVKSGFGEGRCLLASQCVQEGMADRVATLDEVLMDLGASAAATGRRRAFVEKERLGLHR